MIARKGTVAVIVPFHNEEDSLPEALDSIVAQIEQPAQVILVDDHSTDRSVKIAEEYAASYTGWCLISSSLKGVAGARNEGLKIVDTEYVTFLDADDRLLPKACESLVVLAQHLDAEIVYAGHLVSDRWGRRRPLPYLARWTLEGPSRNLRENGESSVAIPVVIGKLFRNDLLRGSGARFPDLEYRSDGVFSAQAWVAARDVRALGEFVYVRRPKPRRTPGLTDLCGIGVVRDQLKAIELVEQTLQRAGIVTAIELNREWGISSALVSAAKVPGEDERKKAFDLIRTVVEASPDLRLVLERRLGLTCQELFAMPLHEVTPTWCRYRLLRSDLLRRIDEDTSSQATLPASPPSD